MLQLMRVKGLCKIVDACWSSVYLSTANSSLTLYTKASRRQSMLCAHSKLIVRSFSSQQHKIFCERLDHRSLIRVSGLETVAYLQGLLTNDVQLLDDSHALYAMMLNVQGRVMHDLILYSTPDGILVECDRDLSSSLISTLKQYKLRKKINIVDVKDEVNVWSLFNESDSNSAVTNINSRDVIHHVDDPRLASLGSRLLLPSAITAMSVVAGCEQSVGKYRHHLCHNGVGEGSVDFPSAQCFPLECNLAFLNGVSFSKGCYIGQELTARTHHTGVIRKRLMPLVITQSSHPVTSDSAVINSTGKACGKVRSVAGSYALGLLRVGDVIGKEPLRVMLEETEIAQVETRIPSWWPSDTDPVLQHTISKTPD